MAILNPDHRHHLIPSCTCQGPLVLMPALALLSAHFLWWQLGLGSCLPWEICHRALENPMECCAKPLWEQNGQLSRMSCHLVAHVQRATDGGRANPPKGGAAGNTLPGGTEAQTWHLLDHRVNMIRFLGKQCVVYFRWSITLSTFFACYYNEIIRSLNSRQHLSRYDSYKSIL